MVQVWSLVCLLSCCFLRLETLLHIVFLHQDVYVVVQIYPWFKFYLPIVLGYMVMYDDDFETMENKI